MHHRSHYTSYLLLGTGALLTALAGCSSSNSDNLAAAGSPGSAGTTGSNAVSGSFQVKLAPDSGTTVFGKVFDGPTPETLIWETAQTSGDCTLTTPRVPYCRTPCGSEACVDDDKCLAYATAHGVGTVTLSGVKTTEGAASFTMAPVANGYQPSGSVSLAYPPFAEGDAVSLSATGDFFPAFSMMAQGIAPLMLSSEALALESGQPLTLGWTKGNAGTIHVKLDISHHGGAKGKIECDTADDGSLDIAAPLVKKLLDLGVAGFPTVIVTRQSIGRATVNAGRVELVVSSTVEKPVTIDGLTSCTKDSECPSGETCQDDLTCK